MKTIIKSTFLWLFFISLYGCAAFGIPETSDPIEKLKWAEAALRAGRPIPAERLLKEAIPLLEQEENWGMLGAAYNIYGRLDYVAPKGKDINYYYAIMNFDKSLEYIEKYLNENEIDKKDKFYNLYYQWATNSAFSLGELYQVNKIYVLSCYYFDKSFEYYNVQLKINPRADIGARGFKSFKEGVKRNKEWSNCSSINPKPSISTIKEVIIKSKQALFDETHRKATKKNIDDSKINYYLSNLASNEIGKRIFILKTIFNDEITDNRIFAVINEMLSNKNIHEDMPNIEADEISWLCKALASSGRKEYEDTIKKVYENTGDNKVRRYAEQSLSILEDFSIRNRDILQQVRK